MMFLLSLIIVGLSIIDLKSSKMPIAGVLGLLAVLLVWLSIAFVSCVEVLL